MTTATRNFTLCALAALALGSAGCRQRMADQPYYRPLEPTAFFADGRASRPIEKGTIHRGQYLETDPLATGLAADEWARIYANAAAPAPKPDAPNGDEERKKVAFGAPRYAPGDAANKVYATEYPFAITASDLKRGQERYTIYCAVCHGALGNGQGKIWERGYLTPTSFHETKVSPAEVDATPKNSGLLELGYSRGYNTWGHRVKMSDAPVGYYFEVITKGYGGMPSYSAQIAPDDRWRIIAYIRVLQMSQRTDPAKLPADVKKLLDEAGGKK
jgi:mono/diheme cytochrome c family protein